MAAIGKAVALLRDAAGFGLFFAGVALEAAGRAVSEQVDEFVDELQTHTEDDEPESAPGPIEVVKSAEARRMIDEGNNRSPRRTEQERPKPLAGSTAARFARGA